MIEAASRIPGLFEALESGSTRADTTLGERVINGRQVRLSFVVEVVDPGGNPLRSHASVNYPNTGTPTERPTNDQLSALIEATRRHRDEGILRQGHGEKWNGETFLRSSVGCLANDINPYSKLGDNINKIVADFYGYPEWLVNLHDGLFQNTDVDIHVRLAAAIKPRDNWQSVMHTIHRRILTEIALPHAGVESTDAVQAVIDLHTNEVAEDSDEWNSAWEAADLASRVAGEISSAEWAAAEAAAASALPRYSVSTSNLAGWAARSAVDSSEEVVEWHDTWRCETTSPVRPAESVEWTAAWKTITAIVLEEVAR